MLRRSASSNRVLLPNVTFPFRDFAVAPRISTRSEIVSTPLCAYGSGDEGVLFSPMHFFQLHALVATVGDFGLRKVLNIMSKKLQNM